MFLEQIDCRIYFTNNLHLRLRWYDDCDLVLDGTYCAILDKFLDLGPFDILPAAGIPRLLMFIQSRTKVRKIKKVFNGL